MAGESIGRRGASKGDESAQDLSTINIQDVNFLKELRVFCHYYQIPYLEDNAPKTTKNAAKIYARMVLDGVDLHRTFKGTRLEFFLKNVSPEELSDDFDPFKLRDKWMRFFRGGLQRPELDTDRVLKNAMSLVQSEYVNDQYLTFNDNQLLRALYLLKNSVLYLDVKLKDLITKQIQLSLQRGRFEVKKGNTLATLAMVFNANHRSWYGTSKDVLFDSQAGDKMYATSPYSRSTIYTGTTFHQVHLFLNSFFIANDLIPFYTSFFESYRPTQKLHVLRFLTSHGVYDQGLFSNFVDQI